MLEQTSSWQEKTDLKFLPEVIDGLEEVVVRYERQVIEDGEVIIVVGSSRVNADKSYIFDTAVIISAVVVSAVVVSAVVFRYPRVIIERRIIDIFIIETSYYRTVILSNCIIIELYYYQSSQSMSYN